jgi:excisionase family DNA binding protein
MLHATSTLMTLSDAAEYLRVSERTILRLIAAGELVAHKVGRQWRLSKVDLQAFLNRSRQA